MRSVDPNQVPSDLNLMGVLKEALSGNEILWGHLTLAKNITLPDMMDTVAKWKSSKSQKSAAVANYTDLSGNLKKAYGKKQHSGRGSGKDQVARRVETRACLASAKRSDILSKTARTSQPKMHGWRSAKRNKTRGLMILVTGSMTDILMSAATLDIVLVTEIAATCVIEAIYVIAIDLERESILATATTGATIKRKNNHFLSRKLTG